MKPLVLSLIVLAFPATAHGDGLPLPVDVSYEGVVSADGGARYITADHKEATTLISQDPGSGNINASRLLDGRFALPMVAYDGSTSGLSADGQTLVLIRPRARFPRKRTSFAVFDTRRLELRRHVQLKGDFSFDALSPDGRSLFLINYLSGKDPAKYRVRVYDLERGRLAPKPIVDPRESPDEMNGMPITRATSPDGRWAYTLYDGAGGHPFIHALDTQDRKAVCIDLHGFEGVIDLYALGLEVSSGGEKLTVAGAPGPMAFVDTETFEVREPPGLLSMTVERERESAFPSLALALGLGGMLAWGGVVAVLLRRSRRRRRRQLDALGAELGDLGPGAAVEEGEGVPGPRTPAL